LDVAIVCYTKLKLQSSFSYKINGRCVAFVVVTAVTLNATAFDSYLSL